MPIIHLTNDYVIPRGRALFDPYDANEELTGEIPFGNCPDVNISIESDKQDHYSSEEGMQEKDGSWPVRVTRSGSLVCDNFSPANAALWLSGAHQKKSQAADPVTGEMRTVIPGRQYQLGATAINPVGVRNVTGVTVKNESGTTTYIAGQDYNLDLETGRVQIIEAADGGSIAAGVVQFGYTPVAASFDSLQSGAKTELVGALRIVSSNATGGNRDWYMPKVSLSASGNLPLIASGNEPVSMEFALEVLKPANGEALYCDGRPIAL